MSTQNTDDWVPLQIKVFTRWVKANLNNVNDSVNDITKDLSNGVALCQLSEILTKKQAPWKKDPYGYELQHSD